MLSYRHGYHAGSFADVLKHSVFAYLVAHAARRWSPLYVLDTHAGAGMYDLTSAYAHKTGEFHAGIEKVIGAPDPVPVLVESYLELVRELNPDGNLRWYPGSPEIAAHFLRPIDRLELIELHGTDHAELVEQFRGIARAQVWREDGLARMRSCLPPPERRGIVLVDPSYEIKSDFEDVVTAMAAAHNRFRSGTFLLWYPVIHRERSQALIDAMAASGIKRQYRIELAMHGDGAVRGMTAAGPILINPPWTVPALAPPALAWLQARLRAVGPCQAGWPVEA